VTRYRLEAYATLLSGLAREVENPPAGEPTIQTPLLPPNRARSRYRARARSPNAGSKRYVNRALHRKPEHEHDFESPYDASLALLDKLNQFPRLAYIPETLFQFFHRLFRVQFCSVQDTVRFL
jgi:hypothetical protein